MSSPETMSEELELSMVFDVTQQDIDVPRLVNPSYDFFFHNFMKRNQPCLIAGVSADWFSTKNWVKNGAINHEYMCENYGDMKVSLSDCEASECKPVDSTVREYMKYLSGGDGTRTDGASLYLKDWHLRRERPHHQFYRVPAVFASDWLNEYSVDKETDDFMFVYIGPKGSWTALHADVYSSYSWSVNVVGRKRWLLVPPGDEERLRDARGSLPPDLRQAGPAVRRHHVVQEAGDAIFVPSAWYHVVYNELDTISINHNWINGCNIMTIWNALKRALNLVEKELDDIRKEDSFADDCQRVLKCDHGLDYNDFLIFILHIGDKRLRQLDGAEARVWGGYRLGLRYVEFDVHAVLDVLDAVLTDQDAVHAVTQELWARLVELKNNIKQHENR